MCEDCRVAVATAEKFDPYAAAPRPAPKTTDDYLRERAAKEPDREAAMLEKIKKGEV